jgi:hypothetical protein
MEPKRKHLSRRILSSAIGAGLILSCVFFLGCNRTDTTSSQATSSASPSSGPVSTGTAVLKADPNPVPPAAPGSGKTTISWQTGTGKNGEVYLVDAQSERLFAAGPSGASEATWLSPGTTRFRLYRGTEHREMLVELSVTMAGIPPGSTP